MQRRQLELVHAQIHYLGLSSRVTYILESTEREKPLSQRRQKVTIAMQNAFNIYPGVRHISFNRFVVVVVVVAVNQKRDTFAMINSKETGQCSTPMCLREEPKLLGK